MLSLRKTGDSGTFHLQYMQRPRSSNSLAVTNIGRGYMQSQQMAERVDCHMDLRSALALGAVVPGSGAALRRRTQRATIDDRANQRLIYPTQRERRMPVRRSEKLTPGRN
jgi:hypothetical protein